MVFFLCKGPFKDAQGQPMDARTDELTLWNANNRNCEVRFTYLPHSLSSQPSDPYDVAILKLQDGFSRSFFAETQDGLPVVPQLSKDVPAVDATVSMVGMGGVAPSYQQQPDAQVRTNRIKHQIDFKWPANIEYGDTAFIFTGLPGHQGDRGAPLFDAQGHLLGLFSGDDFPDEYENGNYQQT